MDPFSITVGTLSLLSAVKATANAVKRLVRLRDVPEELLRLSNVIQDFETTIAKTESIIGALSLEEGSGPYIRALTRLTQRAVIPVDRLRLLLQDHIINDYDPSDLSGNHTKLSFSKRTWLRREKEVKRLQDELTRIGNEISNELVSPSAWSLMVFRTELREVRVLASEVHSTIHRSGEDERTPSLRCQASVPVDNDGDNSPRLVTEEILEEDAPTVKKPSDMAVVSLRQISTDPIPFTMPTTYPPKNDNFFQVGTTTIATRPCKVRLCTCQCHQISQIQPLAWASGVLGSLFIGYSGVTLPFVGRKVKCTEKSCQRLDKGVLKATYYFPGWSPFARRMMSVFDSWNSFDGHQVHIKFPRVIPASSELFTLAQKGNIQGVQRLFAEGKASVYDVNDSEGRSALHFALTAYQPAMAKFLLSQRADCKMEDKYSLSPIDTLWNYVLGDPTKPVYLAFKEVFGSLMDETEDLQKRNFKHIHLIVFGISKVKLEDYLQISTAEIDAQCSFGRTALGWAAQMPGDYKHVQTLVSHGAAIHLADIRGQSPLHLAAETGNCTSLRILLEAASQLQGPDDFQQDLRDRIAAMNFGDDGEEPSEEEEEEEYYDPETPTREEEEEEGEGEEEYFDSKSSFSPASISRKPAMEATIPTSEYCKGLIEAPDYKGRSPLHFATRTNNLEHARLLLRYGADVDHPDRFGRTPLLMALYWDHYDLISLLLLGHGARLDLLDDNKMGVLHYAARWSKLPTLRLLSATVKERKSRKGEHGGGSVLLENRDAQGYAPAEAFLRVRPAMLRETEADAAQSREIFLGLLEKGASGDIRDIVVEEVTQE